MSRTARCLLALGFSVTLAAACGDDDGGINAVGGGAGAGGSSGSAGRGGGAGTAGTAGRGGSAGTAGRGGSAGTPGTGGSAGTAGTGGSAGTGGGAGTGEIPDGGVDDASAGTGGGDSGVVVVVDSGAPDSGVNGNCPDFATQADLIEAGNAQEIVIARVLFRGNGGATVVLRNPSTTTAFNFGDASLLCSGSNDTCSDVSDLDDLAPGAEVSRFLDDTVPAGGEIALLSSDLQFAIAYMAWEGDDAYESEPVTGTVEFPGPTAALDEFASNSNPSRWTLGERIAVTTENTIYGNGATETEAGFDVCTGDPLP